MFSKSPSPPFQHIGMLLALLPISLAGQTQISMGPSAGAQDTVIEVPFVFDTDDQIAGLQIELNFNPAVAEIGTPEVASTATRFRTLGSGVGDGKYRLIVLGEQGDFLPDGRIVKLPVTLKSAVPVGSIAVSMTAVEIADAYGLPRNYRMEPYLELLPPNDGMAVDPLTPIPLSTIADFSGGVSEVEIYANGRLIGSMGQGSPMLNWTPEEPGQTRLKIIGRKADGSSFEASPVDVNVNGETLENYEAWKNFYFDAAQAADAAISAADKDPDGDGRDNLREYAEGTRPTVRDTPPVNPSPFFVQNGGDNFFGVRMRRRIDVPDVTVSATASEDLSTTTESAVTDLEEAGNFEVVTFHTVKSLEEAPKGFLSIQVSAPEAP